MRHLTRRTTEPLSWSLRRASAYHVARALLGSRGMSNNIGRINTPSTATAPEPSEAPRLKQGFRTFVSALFGNGNAKALLGAAGMDGSDMSKLGDRLAGAWNSLARAVGHESQKDFISKI